METPNKPPRKSRRKPSVPEAEREVTVVEQPPTEKPVLKREDPIPNKYEPKPKIGAPTIGRSPNYVKTVGLGKLTVETVNGYSDV